MEKVKIKECDGSTRMIIFRFAQVLSCLIRLKEQQSVCMPNAKSFYNKSAPIEHLLAR